MAIVANLLLDILGKRVTLYHRNLEKKIRGRKTKFTWIRDRVKYTYTKIFTHIQLRRVKNFNFCFHLLISTAVFKKYDTYGNLQNKIVNLFSYQFIEP